VNGYQGRGRDVSRSPVRGKLKRALRKGGKGLGGGACCNAGRRKGRTKIDVWREGLAQQPSTQEESCEDFQDKGKGERAVARRGREKGEVKRL